MGMQMEIKMEEVAEIKMEEAAAAETEEDAETETDTDTDTETETETETEEEMKVYIRSFLDGSEFDAEPLRSESAEIKLAYLVNCNPIFVNSTGDIIRKVRDFCQERAVIKKITDNQGILETKLDEFNSKFVKEYKRDVHELMMLAFFLEIPSLVHALMDAALDYFLLQVSEEKGNEIFDVNLNKLENDVYIHRVMLEHLNFSGEWAFRLPLS